MEKLNLKKLLFLSAAAFIAPTFAQVSQSLSTGVPLDLNGHTVVMAGISSLVTALYALFSNPRHRG